MQRFVIRWAIPALVALVPLGVLGRSVLAQQQTPPQPAQNPSRSNMPTETYNRQNPTATPTPEFNLTQARQMASLVEQGQLNLRDATALAEKQTNGTALEVVCTIEPTTNLPGETGKPAPSGAMMGRTEKSTSNQRLVYDVTCFRKDKVETVRVDGLARKVMEQTPAHAQAMRLLPRLPY